MKQSLAIAYSTKRANMKKKKKTINMSDGGRVAGQSSPDAYKPQQPQPSSLYPTEMLDTWSTASQSRRKPEHDQYAEGGEVGQDSAEMQPRASQTDKQTDGQALTDAVERSDEALRKAKAKHPGMDMSLDSTKVDMYAGGGEVENEDMDPEHTAGRIDPNAARDEMGSMEDSDLQQDLPTLSESLSLAEEIMKDRKRRYLAKGGAVEAREDELDGNTPAYGDRMDLEPVHTMEDEEHPDQDSPSRDDDSLVGQILRERKMRRRG